MTVNEVGDVPAPGTSSPIGLPDLLAAAVCVVDERGVISAVNAQAERLFRRAAADLVGRDPHDLLHRDRHGQPLARAQSRLVEAFLARRTGAGSGWFARGDGSLAELCWLVTPCSAMSAGEDTAVIFYEGDPLARTVDPPPRGDRSTLPELERLALLAETTTQLTSTLDSDEALRRLVRLVIPRLADWAVVDLITEVDEVERTIVVHHEDGVFVHREDLQGPMPPVPAESPMPLSRALRGAASTLVTPMTYQGPPDSGIAIEQRRLFEATGMHSAAIAPIRGYGTCWAR